MEVLRKLIEENTPPSTESKDVTDSSKETSSTLTSSNDETQSAPSIVGGKLLLFGSIDWENASSKSCEGLPSPHLINFHIPVLKTFSSSSSKYFFILLLDGTLYGMGSNDSGQLGTGDSISYNSPVLINQSWNTSSSLIQKISTGRSHTIFLHENGEIYGCGSNSCGQLGMGTIDNQLYPSRIPLNDIRDIACGYDHSLVCTRSGQLYAFGHPEYGQLGDGKTGEYIQQSQKVLYNYVTKPKLVQRFITKDQRGDIIRTVTDQDIRIRCVSAGRNHSCCLEDWEDEEGNEVPNRVYSWGFGGYGRLGHSSASDEHIPREISVFSPVQGRPHFPQKQIRQLYCGSTYSLFISKANNLYFNGILPNSPRKEACTYPRVQQELYDWSANQLSGGSSWVLISADSNAIFWGVPVAGTFGLENDIKRSATPVIVSAVSNMKVLDISSGYCHSCIVVAPDNMSDSTTIELFENKMQSLPSLVIEDRNANTSNSGKGKKRGSTNISSQSSNKKGKKK